MDDRHAYELVANRTAIRILAEQLHLAGVLDLRKYANAIDLQAQVLAGMGAQAGENQGFIPVADRLNEFVEALLKAADTIDEGAG